MLLLLIFSSCEFDDNYNYVGVADWVWWVLVFFVIVLVVSFIGANKNAKETGNKLSERGLKLSDFKIIGNYVGGHPDFDKEILGVSVKDAGDSISFYQQGFPTAMPYHRFDILKSNIDSISIEDASTIEKRLTVGRLFLVGIFALAWKKKKKNEIAFMVIDWKDGRFSHSTTFVNEGKDAMQKANTSRNHLIRLVK